MRTLLEQSVLHSIRAAQMIAPGDRIGVAVSGGADSVALLRMLQNLREELGITLLVVHFDHMLRGEDSQADAQFVKDLARALSLEIVIGQRRCFCRSRAARLESRRRSAPASLRFLRKRLRQRTSNPHRSRSHGARSSRNSSRTFNPRNWHLPV